MRKYQIGIGECIEDLGFYDLLEVIESHNVNPDKVDYIEFQTLDKNICMGYIITPDDVIRISSTYDELGLKESDFAGFDYIQ